MKYWALVDAQTENIVVMANVNIKIRDLFTDPLSSFSLSLSLSLYIY